MNDFRQLREKKINEMIKTLLMEKFLTLCYVENIVMLICMASCKLEDSNDFNTEFNLLWRWQEMALLEELKYIVLNTQYFKADFLIKNVFHFFLYSFFFSFLMLPFFVCFCFVLTFFLIVVIASNSKNLEGRYRCHFLKYSSFWPSV